MISPKSKALGRGLEAIFDLEGTSLPEKSKTTIFSEIEIGQITPNPKQPRTHFSEDALEELAESIRTLGVIQPITVKKTGEGSYIIISGERRYRASKQVGLETIPAYIREVDDQTLLEMAIVENIQRQDLNAIEVALSLQRLVDECDLTQDSLAERVGKKRSTVANYMRLLKLPSEVQLAVKEELISMGHARAIAGVVQTEHQLSILKKTIKKALSVRQVEELAKAYNQAKEEQVKQSEEGLAEFPEVYTKLVEQLEKLFSQDISIKKSNKGGGKIVIGFESDDNIEELLRKLERL